MRLQTVRRPDPLHAAMTDPAGFGHRPTGPVRRLARRFGQRHRDHPLDGHRRQRLLAARPRRVVQQPIDPLATKRACQRQIVGLPLPVWRWIEMVPTPSPLSSTIRARHTCFCGLFPDPITASSRSRSPGPSRTAIPFRIPISSHSREPNGIFC